LHRPPLRFGRPCPRRPGRTPRRRRHQRL